MVLLVFADGEEEEEDARHTHDPGCPVEKPGFCDGIEPAHILERREEERGEKERRGDRISIMMLHAMKYAAYRCRDKFAVGTSILPTSPSAGVFAVGGTGIEPVTSTTSMLRSTK